MNSDVISELTDEQMMALREFKRRVAIEHGEEASRDEHRLRRFLRARMFDVEKAEAMFRNHLSWREKNHIDTIRKDYKPPEVLKKYLPLSKIGFDREGLPTNVLNFGTSDIKGMLMAAKKSDMVRTTVQFIENDVEQLRQKSQEKGQVFEKWNYILDFDNYSLAQATYKEGAEILMHLLSIYEANYPERLKEVYIINASVYFTIIFSFIKPVLSGETLQKLRVFGKDGWKQELQRLMPMDVLPACYGGNRTDPDGNPKCATSIVQGGLVPKSYYLSKSERCLSNEPGVKKYNVQRMSRFTIDVEIEQPRSIIEWEFETENYNIGFGISFAKAGFLSQKRQELIPVQKVDTRFLSEAGIYTCTEPGTYSLVFDNTYSWLRQKEVHCRAYVVNPSGKRICVTE